MKELEKRLAKLEKKLAKSEEPDAETLKRRRQRFVNNIIKMDAQKKEAIARSQKA